MRGYTWDGWYPGDSPGKAKARADLYEVALRSWMKVGRPGGWAVVLAGEEAMELELLRDVLRWDPKRTLFVDRLSKGLRRVSRLWPEAQTYYGNIETVLKRVDSIGFLNLDFMGKFNESVLDTLAGAKWKILPRGVVSYTFHRSREHYTHRSNFLLHNTARELLSEEQLKDLDLVRWVGSARLLEKNLALSNPKLLMSQRYTSTRSAMGVISVLNRA